MIGQKKKPTDEIIAGLEGKQKIVIMGCGGCAKTFKTGGDAEVREMEKTLAEKGKTVLAAIQVPYGEFTCYAPQSIKRVAQNMKAFEECDAILMLSCGDGLQVVNEILLEGEKKLIKPIMPANDTIGLMGGGPELFKEKCQQCGECIVGMFAGICPLSQCAKGLLNGPCGGYKKDKCETDPERDCAWVKIYKRMEEAGLAGKLEEIIPPKDWKKRSRPRSVTVK
jgi:ferredoxin